MMDDECFQITMNNVMHANTQTPNATRPSEGIIYSPPGWQALALYQSCVPISII